MNAEIVAAAIGEKVLETLEKEEQHIDTTLRQLENADDEELERIREKRLKRMREQAEKMQALRAQGHGEYTTLVETNEFFDVIKKSENVVTHFFTPANAFCLTIDGHLQLLAAAHLETRFVRINAEKAQFLVEKLGIWMIPSIALIKDQKVVKMLHGLDELGGTEKFSTAFLAYFLSSQNILKYDGSVPESFTDDCGLYRNTLIENAKQKDQPNATIRQTVFYDSDLEDEK